MEDYLISGILILLSACFSGLTLGYFTLNSQTLRRKAKFGDADARRILSVRENSNVLLTTLLLSNVAVNAVLSVYLSTIASGIMAAFLATVLIFVFGEILPQATFARHAIKVGAIAAPFIRVLILILYPITYPIAYTLDKLLGAEMQTVYSKRELMAIVSEIEDAEHGSIDKDEERIVHGALKFSHIRVREAMTPKESVVAFDEHARIDRELINELAAHGHSRYPIYSGNPENIVGLMFTKDLLQENPSTPIRETSEAFEEQLLTVRPDDLLDGVLARMLKQRKHLAIVQTRNEQFLGVISLEDIIEEIIQVEIEDEDDIPEPQAVTV